MLSHLNNHACTVFLSLGLACYHHFEYSSTFSPTLVDWSSQHLGKTDSAPTVLIVYVGSGGGMCFFNNLRPFLSTGLQLVGGGGVQVAIHDPSATAGALLHGKTSFQMADNTVYSTVCLHSSFQTERKTPVTTY